MKHAASQELYAYWEERRGQRPAPERAEIEPGAIRQVLSDAFILALDDRAGHPFRLAGTRVCALFGRELKGERFIGLWAAASQPIMSDLLPSSTTSASAPLPGSRRIMPTANRSSWNCCCCRSVRRGRASPAPSGSWRR